MREHTGLEHTRPAFSRVLPPAAIHWTELRLRRQASITHANKLLTRSIVQTTIAYMLVATKYSCPNALPVISEAPKLTAFRNAQRAPGLPCLIAKAGTTIR